MNIAGFRIADEKCAGCGACTLVCPGGILYLDENGRARMRRIEEFGWNGCWRCEHCLAVCPEGAISVFGHEAKDSLPPTEVAMAGRTLDSLIANRRSCRRYRERNVPGEVIDDMLRRLAGAPNGGNKQQVELTLIDDKEQMRLFRRKAYRGMERLAAQNVFPPGFDRQSYEDMKRWERTVRPDMLFCGAPHILIPHAPKGRGTPEQDVVIAAAYFELLCASRGLGAVMMTFPLGILELLPDVKDLLRIPKDHHVGVIVGFGYPEIPYARGAQREIAPARVHRIAFRAQNEETESC